MIISLNYGQLRKICIEIVENNRE